MARSSAWGCLLAAVALSSLALTVQAGVNITSLPVSIVVQALINGEPVSAVRHLRYLQDNLTVMWHLNASFVGTDQQYKTVVIKLCYGTASVQGRGWRAPNTDLSKSKVCPTVIAAQVYGVPSVVVGAAVVPGNQTVWQADMSIPGALYFVRAFALNSTSATASPANSAVAMGQSSDPSSTQDLVEVVPYPGTTTTLDITIIVLSVASFVLLMGFFVLERYIKKNK